ncbi:MAG: putative sugar O-methyltransferase [Nitrospira sp.]|mgnify:CR=1 FL=1|jgi:hypothetical protein|nr:putative sugar O-methyltransferase [Nitrospira sp.]
MLWSARDKVMFQTVFSPSRAEALHLMDFARYLWAENIADQVASHPLFAPSSLWRHWAGQSFVGLSLEKLILQGGHAFPHSVEVAAEEREIGLLAAVRQCVGIVRAASTRTRMREGRDPHSLAAAFARCYPQAHRQAEHESWYARHPNPYFRCLEAYLLRQKPELPTRMLEVGGGACVNVAFYHSLNRRMRTVVVDLPETIFFGYTFLRAVFPDMKIALPHEAGDAGLSGEAEVRFLLPTQTELIPDDSVDFGFNMASFQEMSLATVNQYLALMARKLRVTGRLVSMNCEVSRYFKENTLKSYDLAGYHSVASMKDAPFTSELAGPGLRVVHLEIEKRSGAGA